MNFTKEEIALCKKIVEKYRKKIKYGDWFLNAWGKATCACGYAYPTHKPIRRKHEHPKWIPLWQISDCLEFLEKKYKEVSVGNIDDEWDVQVFGAFDNVKHPEFLEDIRGKTPLEAFLKAVLAIVEEKNGKT